MLVRKIEAPIKQWPYLCGHKKKKELFFKHGVRINERKRYSCAQVAGDGVTCFWLTERGG